ncbi:MAG: hypothetical protein ACYTG0_47050 [Planctomycetota bacterium]|jgi:hypothetical protein
MSKPQVLSPDTVARAADELVGMPIDADSLEAAAALLSGLILEMGPMRALDSADAEPATVYRAIAP